MKNEQAQNIISEYKLITGDVSRKILYAIENNISIDSGELPAHVTEVEIEKLRLLYQAKCQEIGCQINPRNLIFYHIIKDKIPEFTWKVNSSDELTEIRVPRIKNLRPSLLSLLLDRVRTGEDTKLHRKYEGMNRLPLHVVQCFEAMLEEIKVIYPTKQNMSYIEEWIRKGLSEQNLSIFSPICPDYSVEPTGNPKCPFRHTFKELGSGLGLIAQRILSAIPIIKTALDRCGIQVKIIIGFGDFEAYSIANLERLNITTDEFLNRVNKSKLKFENSISLNVEICMITDLFGGFQNWRNIYEEFTSYLNQGNFGSSQLSNEKLIKIVQKRKNLYDRWYGKKQPLAHIPQLLSQGAEYATLGAFISRCMRNCLVLGADNDAMSPFYSIEQVVPTLYLKRFYC